TPFPYTTLFRSHVSDPVLVPSDRHFRAIRERFAIFAAHPNALACSALLENHFPGSLLTDGRADRPNGSFDPVIPVEHLRIGYLHDPGDRKSTRLNSSHVSISYAVFCLKKKNK